MTEQENELQSSRSEKRKQQMAIRRRNRIIGNIMIYSGIGILVILCVIVIFFLFKGQSGQGITSLNLSEEAVDIRMGYTLQLKPVTEPKGVEYALTYVSSDESIASVSPDGVITAHKKGAVTVTVSSGGKSDTCVVTVKPDSIDTLTRKNDYVNLEGGQTIPVPYEFTPITAKDKEIVFESDNPEIAVVDEEGNIKGVSTGSAIITVKDNVTGKTVKIVVSVSGNEKVSSMAFSETSITLELKEEQIYKSELIFTPEDISNRSVVYYTSDEAVATVNENGEITAVGGGTCTITAVYEADNTIEATMEVNVIDAFVIIDSSSEESELSNEQSDEVSDEDSGDEESNTEDSGELSDEQSGEEESSDTEDSGEESAESDDEQSGGTTVPVIENPNTEIVNGVTYVEGILIANKTYSLPSDYNPGVDSNAYAALEQMQQAAAADGVVLFVVSGFRDYETQKAIYSRYVYNNGQENADRFSARPGHSEHQTGLAFDLNSLSESFGDTREGIWLSENCHKFGFIIRYPKGKEHITGYMYEPWHVRYLGTENAEKIYASGLTVEEYLGISSTYGE